MLMHDKIYNGLRFAAEVGIPALVTLVLAVTSIWGLPYGEQIGATIAAIGVFVGAFVGVSRSVYNDVNHNNTK